MIRNKAAQGLDHPGNDQNRADKGVCGGTGQTTG
jgi:hypothetical protein